MYIAEVDILCTCFILNVKGKQIRDEMLSVFFLDTKRKIVDYWFKRFAL